MKILVDTNVLIDFTHGYADVLSLLLKKQSKGEVELFTNPIVQAEFLADTKLKRPHLLSKAQKFLSLFSTLPIGKTTAFIAGEILRNNLTPTLADAFIAATCLEHSLYLFTRNQKHFLRIKGLELLDINSPF